MSADAGLVIGRVRTDSIAETALKGAAGFWFVTALVGQWVFAFYIAANYGSTAMRGDFGAWNQVLTHGYKAGATAGNTVLGLHLLFAAMVSFGGALQLIPRIRTRFPAFHRWNGRIYLFAALIMGTSGLYLVSSGRKVVGDASQHAALALNAVLILLFAALALRAAMKRDFKRHRAWALRLFLVMSGVWFFRVELMVWYAIFRGPVGFDPQAFAGPALTFMNFAQFLLPLGVLELYLRAKARPHVPARFATASLLLVLTLAMGAGIAGATAGMWTPRIKKAFDSRKSIARILSATIAADGLDAAIKQYQELKATSSPTYNFDEEELDSVGYELIHDARFKDAARILEMNVAAYPASSNVYDSLGEAYMDAGEKPLAIANYQKSLQLNPKSANAVKMLKKLNTP